MEPTPAHAQLGDKQHPGSPAALPTASVVVSTRPRGQIVRHRPTAPGPFVSAAKAPAPRPPRLDVIASSSPAPVVSTLKAGVGPGSATRRALVKGVVLSAIAAVVLKQAAKAAGRLVPFLLHKRAVPGPAPRPGAGGGRKPALLWFRNDVRLHDNEALAAANRHGSSLLPVYVFDPREFGDGTSSGGVSAAAASRNGPYRARFIVDSVSELRSRLREMGSDLVVRVGAPEEVLPALAAQVGAGSVFCTGEVGYEDGAVEAELRRALQRGGGGGGGGGGGQQVELRTVWGNALLDEQDLPFTPQQTPPTYSAFRQQVSGARVRRALPAPIRLRGLPLSSEPVAPGYIPSLSRLGFAPASLLDASPTALPARGGEAAALRHVDAFMARVAAGAGGTGLATSAASAFCSEISPWLAVGCLSPRHVYQQLRARLGDAATSLRPATTTANAATSAPPQLQQQAQQPGATWFVYELLWRDFFRLTTRKYTLTMVVPPQPSPSLASSAATGSSKSNHQAKAPALAHQPSRQLAALASA